MSESVRQALKALAFVIGLIMIVSVLTSSCTPYAAAWKACAAVQDAGNRTDDALAEAAMAKKSECVKAHGAKTAEYATCIEPVRQILIVWITYVRPAISTALRTTATALQIAEKVRGGEINWIGMLRPGVCALAKAVGEWAHLMGRAADQVRGYLGLIKGVTCE